jgi:ABC-2 type transport system permease protein
MIWVLFLRFGDLKLWRLEEVCLFYGVVNISFALADAVSPGFDVFGPQYIKTGNFDRLLLRPRSVVLQLL